MHTVSVTLLKSQTFRSLWHFVWETITRTSWYAFGQLELLLYLKIWI